MFAYCSKRRQVLTASQRKKRQRELATKRQQKCRAKRKLQLAEVIQQTPKRPALHDISNVPPLPVVPATPSTNASALHDTNTVKSALPCVSQLSGQPSYSVSCGLTVNRDILLSRSVSSTSSTSTTQLQSSSSSNSEMFSPSTPLISAGPGSQSEPTVPLVRFGNKLVQQLGDSPFRDYKWCSKRGSEVTKVLPADRHKRCSVVVWLMQYILTSPETEHIAAHYLRKNRLVCERVRQFSSELLDENLDYRRRAVKNVMRVQAAKLRKDSQKHQAATQQLKTMGSLRKLSFSVGVSKSTLQHISRTLVTLTKRMIQPADRQRVIDFFHRNTITLRLPEKKRARHRYLRMSWEDAHREYKMEMKEQQQNVLSLSSCQRVLRMNKEFFYKTVRQIPKQSCQCKRCTNLALKRDALLAAKLRGVYRRTIDNLFSCCCEPDPNRTKQIRRNLQDDIREAEGERDIMQLDRDCIFAFCRHCTASHYEVELVSMNKGRDLRENVAFKEWRYSKKKKVVLKKVEGEQKKVPTEVEYRDYSLQRDVKPLGELLCLWSTEVKNMALHYFNIKWQDKQFDQRLKSLQAGDVVMVMDFAQNLTHEEPVETQGAHWHHHQSALHPVVCYYRCSQRGCSQLVTHEIMCLSDDLKHDVVTVEAFETVAMKVLTENHILVNRVFQFCDNCASQYKCAKAWASLAKRKIPTMRSYFAPCHGKGPADGAIGRIVQLVDRDVKSNNVLGGISNAQDFVRHCRGKYETREQTSTLCPDHYRRCFRYVPVLQREEEDTVGTIPGSMQLYCVRNLGLHGFLEVRLNSCFCW